jgi:dTDP-3-amino-2,3,6-trideoxy-4-keto-D-glucose/dTDP-3-amino-3,4,6-trideoxy-alpha-D-glucose/dTDP-2,6-dideoxy-D-kanosamine transaminase
VRAFHLLSSDYGTQQCLLLEGESAMDRKHVEVPYLDLRVLDKAHKKALLKRFEKVLTHGRIIAGPEVEEFEERIARRIGVKHAVGTGSGSSAIFLALKALGIGRGDEVITTPFTWIITVNAIAATGAKPVFVDIGEDFNIDLNQVEQKITPKTRAIVPMHVAGHLCEMTSLQKIARTHSLHVVEDAAQAICGSLGSRQAGSFSAAAAFSMNPMKVLHGYGETGVVTTNNDRVYNRLLKLRHAGTRRDPTGRHFNRCDFVSLNHKIDTVQAAFLLENLERLESIWQKRDRIARKYDSLLKNVVGLQELHPNEIHGRYLYLIRCKKRDALRKVLEKNGVETKIVYSPLACDAAPYKTSQRLHLPVSRRLLREVLSIPLHEKMLLSQAEFVSDIVRSFVDSG